MISLKDDKETLIADLKKVIEESQLLKTSAEITLGLMEKADTEEKVINALNYFGENEEKLTIIELY